MRYTQDIIDLIVQKKCATRYALINHLMEKYGGNRRTMANVVDRTVKKLIRHGIVKKKVKGLYCSEQ